MGKKEYSSVFQRNSNTEMLRIIAMLMIVASHYSYHGGFDFSQIENPANYLFLKAITLGNLGVDVFVLLFGYYSISYERINAKKVFLLWSQVFSYSFLIFCGLFLGGIIEFSAKDFVRSALPTIFSKYWFFTSYIVLLLLTPFVNRMLKSLSQEEYRILLGVMLVIWCIIPTISAQVPGGDNFALFLMLYSLGGYLKLFPGDKYNRKKYGDYMVILSVALMLGSTVCVFLLKRIIPFFEGKETLFYHKNSLFVIFTALGMLIIALNQEPRRSNVINLISSCTFGIYLLHDNDLMRRPIWGSIFRNSAMAESPFLIFHCLSAVLTIFGVGVIIELIRKYTLEKIWICVFDWLVKQKDGNGLRGKMICLFSKIKY